jgi:hypothetical protein
MSMALPLDGAAELYDPYGFVPMFQWDGPNGRVVRPSIEELLATGASRTLDFDALSVFLRLGFFLGADTPFASIRAVTPQRQPYTGPALTLSRDQAVDAFIDVFRAAIGRCLPRGEFHMPLSGGRDSRHILCALVEAGDPPTACVTIEHFPPRGNDDVAIAAALCGRLGIRHVILPQRHDRVRAEREKNRRTHFCTEEHAHFVALADYLASVTRETYDGIGGDVLSQSTYLRPDIHRLFEQRKVEQIATYLLDGYGATVSERALQSLLSPVLMRQVPRDRAVARLSTEIRRHFDAPNPVASFFFWNRTRREIALSPFALMRDVRVHTPYLDDDVYALLSAMPASAQMDRALHTDAIRLAYPRVADIPYESKAHRQRRPGFHRRAALDFARVAFAAPRGTFSRRLAAPIAATVIDASADRLWQVSLGTYLAQLRGLAAARAR